MLKIFLNIFILLTSLSTLIGQDIIRLHNPSFEGIPAASKVPTGWYDCSKIEFPRQSPPDIHPITNFGDSGKSKHGKTFMGMVVRENATWESVSQKLRNPLQEGAAYSFSIFLRLPKEYNSTILRSSGIAKVNFNKPISLIIWGGNDYCDKKEILAESEPIENLDWQEYSFMLIPEKGDYEYISLEAYYQTGFDKAYNGSILLDKCSEIIRID